MTEIEIPIEKVIDGEVVTVSTKSIPIVIETEPPSGTTPETGSS